MKQKILMLVGIPGSGKSYFRKHFIGENENWAYTNRDEIRLEFPDEEWSKANEKKYLDIEHSLGNIYLAGGFNLILDNTNFNKAHEDYWRKIAKEKGYDFEIMFFNTPLKTCLERNSLRAKPVPESVIKQMYNTHVRNNLPTL